MKLHLYIVILKSFLSRMVIPLCFSEPIQHLLLKQHNKDLKYCLNNKVFTVSNNLSFTIDKSQVYLEISLFINDFWKYI